MEQPEETPVVKTMGNDDALLIRKIYELTHQTSIADNPALRLELKTLTAEAEKRNLL